MASSCTQGLNAYCMIMRTCTSLYNALDLGVGLAVVLVGQYCNRWGKYSRVMIGHKDSLSRLKRKIKASKCFWKKGPSHTQRGPRNLVALSANLDHTIIHEGVIYKTGNKFAQWLKIKYQFDILIYKSRFILYFPRRGCFFPCNNYFQWAHSVFSNTKIGTQ